jgi:putative tricarboxylic transport membrane protein
LLEEKVRQALVLSRGSFMVFLERPVSAGLLAVAVIIVVLAVTPAIRQGRETAFQE